MRAVDSTMMNLTVILCAYLKDRCGTETLQVQLPHGTTGTTLITHLTERYPSAADWLRVSRVAVHCEYVPLEQGLHDGDEVVLIPPVSGG